jgi:hypothetical protein
MPDTAPISFRLLRPPILGTLLIAHLNGRSIPVGYVRFTSRPCEKAMFKSVCGSGLEARLGLLAV